MENLSELTAISPLDGRYGSKLEPLRSICSEYGLIRFRIIAEIYWLIALAQTDEIKELPPLSNEALQFLTSIIDQFNESEAKKIKAIEQETNHDVKSVEYYLKEKFAENEELKKHREFIHFACTSEDINNLAYALMIKTLRDDHCLPSMMQVINALKNLARDYADAAMLSRTHGQAATPTTMGKEFANFAARLETQYERLKALPIKAKCNGAVGNFNAHTVAYPKVDWPTLSKTFIENLGLEYNAYTTQIEPHDYIADLCLMLSHFNTILIDVCRDIWTYISIDYFKQKSKAGEVGSSTMPHKVNPIDFENAEGNLGLANTLLQHLANKLPISRLQRDLSDSTVLRNIGVSFAYGLLANQSLLKGLSKLVLNQDALSNDLNAHWEILAEPIQTVMRRYGKEAAYEQLKALTRGKAVSAEEISHFIDTLDLSKDVKAALKNLTPESYIGLAEKLAKDL